MYNSVETARDTLNLLCFSNPADFTRRDALQGEAVVKNRRM